MRRYGIIALGVPALMLASSGVHAQQTSRPFERATVGIALAVDAGRGGAVHRYWSPGPSVEATVAFPFYAGTVETGAQYAHYDARAGDVPGFGALLLFVGWRTETPLANRLRIGGGARLGLYDIRFDGDTIPAFRRDESELAFVLRPTVDYAIGRAWHLYAASAYQVVYTQPRIEQVLLSAGLARSLGVPSWLRDFLD